MPTASNSILMPRTLIGSNSVYLAFLSKQLIGIYPKPPYLESTVFFTTLQVAHGFELRLFLIEGKRRIFIISFLGCIKEKRVRK